MTEGKETNPAPPSPADDGEEADVAAHPPTVTEETEAEEAPSPAAEGVADAGAGGGGGGGEKESAKEAENAAPAVAPASRPPAAATPPPPADDDFGDFEEADLGGTAAEAAPPPVEAPPPPIEETAVEAPATEAPPRAVAEAAIEAPDAEAEVEAPMEKAAAAPAAPAVSEPPAEGPAEEASPAEVPPAEEQPMETHLAERKEEGAKEKEPASAPPPPPAEQSASAEAKAAGNSTPHPVDNAVRATSHSRLRAYEAKRRSAYTSKLSSSSLYWRSFRDLLHSSLEETERAEVLVRGSAYANRAYSEAMACAAEDSLDDDGRPITDPKKKKKLRERREKIRAERRGYHGHAESAAATLQGETEEGRRRGSRLHSKPQDSSLEKRGMMLHTLVESHGVMAERFAENARFVEEEMAKEIGMLRAELAGEVDTMEKLGDAILDELEDAEHEVDRAWEKYYAVATKSLGQSTRTAGRQGASSVMEHGVVEKEPIADCLDVWVVEMQYRMSVAYLSACWEKCSSELSKLFASMKETECNRRSRLRELMITFVQRQERLWLSLPSVLTPVLKDLVDRPMDRTSIENDVQQSIRLRAQGIQREEHADKHHKGQADRPSGPGLTGVNAAEGNFELSSPLLSDLLFKAHVIEKRGSGYMSGWKTTLAVVTADSFLHLFELPAAVRVQSGSAPEVAFHALVPPVEVPTQETIKHRSASKRSASEWYEHLVPAESLVLPNCTIQYKDEPGNTMFEVKETVFNVGASKVFGSTTTRKLYLRTLSREETTKWIKALKAPK